MREVKGLDNAPNSTGFVLSNAFMGYGESGNVIFEIPGDKAYEAIDVFGKTVSFKSDPGTPEKLTCSVYANHYSMKHWAMQNADFVKVISPVSLVEEIKESLSKGLAQYQQALS